MVQRFPYNCTSQKASKVSLLLLSGRLYCSWNHQCTVDFGISSTKICRLSPNWEGTSKNYWVFSILQTIALIFFFFFILQVFRALRFTCFEILCIALSVSTFPSPVNQLESQIWNCFLIYSLELSCDLVFILEHYTKSLAFSVDTLMWALDMLSVIT